MVSLGAGFPATEIIGEEVTILEDEGDVEVVTPAEDTTSILIYPADSNSAKIYIGGTSDVSDQNGIPLSAGTPITLDLNVAEAPVYAYPAADNLEVRFFALD